MCKANLKNRWAAKLTIPVIIYLCTDCSYSKKAFIQSLRDRLPVELIELRGIGADLLALCGGK